MTGLIARRYKGEDDYWRIRDFLRRVFLLNDRREDSWPVARFDYWRWHLIANCQYCGPPEEVTTIWETPGGEIGAVLHPIVTGELRLHVHPHRRSLDLEDEMFATGEEGLARVDEAGQRSVYLGVDEEDILRKQALTRRRYARHDFTSHKWYRDLGVALQEAPIPLGYVIRSMGDIDEHPVRSWASWRAFHSDEPDEDYDGDWSWIQNIQSAPLYRRDLDLVAVAPGGEIASFCTIYYDDVTRAAVCVLVGTAVEYQRRGLGKAVMVEGLRRLHRMGCTRVFATAYDPPADALYSSVMEHHVVCRTWLKQTPAP
jgi:GNAT superfamily N-acetyltransferase